jgi:division protein CdvB (Snf7/Vps24/ESCRT-III family)
VAGGIVVLAKKYDISVSPNKSKALEDLTLKEIDENFLIVLEPGKRVTGTTLPLKKVEPKVNSLIKTIRLQIHELDHATDIFGRRDKTIFARIVNAYTKHDLAAANVFANHLEEIRKTERLMINLRLTFEQISSKLLLEPNLETFASNLASSVSMLESVGTNFECVFPESRRTLDGISSLAKDILIDIGRDGGLTIDFKTANKCAHEILSKTDVEAKRIARDIFPRLPSSIERKTRFEEDTST